MAKKSRQHEKSALPVQKTGRIKVGVARAVPSGEVAIGVPVGTRGAVPRQIGLDRDALAEAGFEGKVGQALLIPQGKKELVIAVGIGDAELDAAQLRNAAAAFARAASRRARLATSLADVASGVEPDVAAQAVVEGVLLARYRYDQLKTGKKDLPLEELTLVTSADRLKAETAGAERGHVLAAAATFARDLANAPAGHLPATKMADIAVEIGGAKGIKVEVFDKADLQKLGCGGILGVNAGSTEPPRMVKMTYAPKKGGSGHLALVGKGIMYDSGGINLKPAQGMQLYMKMDMAGAAAVLAAMSALPDLDCKAKVTAYLMCTDNMPSGSAQKMGDVLTQRNGKTVEIHNTDAEGRLILADGLALAAEEKPDAIVNIGTLTGAIFAALGEHIAGLFSNHDGFAGQMKAASQRTDESVWQMPLDHRYRKQIDSAVADLRNLGDAQPGSITAALFLEEFVDGLPWGHIDICGTMKLDADDGWRPRGATGFGARLLADLAVNFTAPK
jgi:leucyl aminopeptidase